jgi:hypothetical protein
VHDAILIEAPLDELDQVIERTKTIMSEASAIVLDGFKLGSDAQIICYPDRYSDERGVKMWQAITDILDQLDPSTCAEMHTDLCANALKPVQLRTLVGSSFLL